MDKRVLRQIWDKYQRYIIAGILLVVFIVIVVVAASGKKGGKNNPTEAATEPATTAAEFELDKEFKVDAIPEMNQLFTTYYTAYAKDDLETLGKIAYPMSDNEKSYIGVYSQYIKGYSNLKCYSKSGLSKGSYIVSVYYELEFYGVATKAQGIDSFYVETDKEGKLYINNTYSTYNFKRAENPLDPKINAVIIRYGKQEDVVKLSNEVSAKFETSIAADQNLAKMIATTLPTALKDWSKSVHDDAKTQNAQAGQNTTEQTAQNAQSGQAAQPAQSGQAAQPAQSGQAAQPAQNAQSGQAAQPAQNAQNGQAAQPAQNAQSGQAAQPAQSGQAAQPAQSGQAAQAAQPAQSGQAAQPAQTGQAAQPAQNAAGQTNAQTDQNKAAKKAKSKKVKTTDRVFLREKPSTDADYYDIAEKGEKFKVVSEKNGWTEIKWKGRKAYIKSEYLKKVK